MKVAVESTLLETLLVHAAAAARLIGHLDDAPSATPLADHVDAIVHELSELLGTPDLIAAPVTSGGVTLRSAAADLLEGGVR